MAIPPSERDYNQTSDFLRRLTIGVLRCILIHVLLVVTAHRTSTLHVLLVVTGVLLHVLLIVAALGTSPEYCFMYC